MLICVFYSTWHLYLGQGFIAWVYIIWCNRVKFMEKDMVFIFNLILNIFFFHFLGQKSKHKMGKCKQKLKPLYDGILSMMERQKEPFKDYKNWKHEDLGVRFSFQKVFNLWNGSFIFRGGVGRGGEVKNILKNRVFKSHNRVTKRRVSLQRTPADRHQWDVTPQHTAVRGDARCLTTSHISSRHLAQS